MLIPNLRTATSYDIALLVLNFGGKERASFWFFIFFFISLIFFVNHNMRKLNVISLFSFK
jgi:hypothetical protein